MVTLLDEVHPFFKWCGTESLTHGLGTEVLDESTYRHELNRVKFEVGPCPDALLLSPPASSTLACTVSFG
jgi:hypothetical protein